MHRLESKKYRCPVTHSSLKVTIKRAWGPRVMEGALVAPSGASYPIKEGMPDFTYPQQLTAGDKAAYSEYQQTVAVYDEYTPLTFRTYGEDETRIRNEMIDAMKLTPGSKVLEFGCGTGRDSSLIARRLNYKGKLYLQDLSPAMLSKCATNLKKVRVPVEFAVANGCWLPFPNRTFDAVYHFGGLNTFSDIHQTFCEIARVTKIGGRVVIGDESMAPWLRKTEYGKILMNSNPMFHHKLPLEYLPVEARHTNIKWILGETFYYISFEIGKGEPSADFDFKIPGTRGGTHRTRYYGQLEGVSPKTKELALAAQRKMGMSMHDWVDDVVRQAAEITLQNMRPRRRKKYATKKRHK